MVQHHLNTSFKQWFNKHDNYLKTDKILFNIGYLDQQEYNYYRSIEHGITAWKNSEIWK